VKVELDANPLRLLQLALNKVSYTKNKSEDPSNYLLKVCGQQEFLVGEHALVNFTYIHDALSRDIVPVVVVVSASIVKDGKILCYSPKSGDFLFYSLQKLKFCKKMLPGWTSNSPGLVLPQRPPTRCVKEESICHHGRSKANSGSSSNP
jgi:PI3-kinase family, ras-binding domain